MEPFLTLTADARIRLCDEAQARIGLPAASIEKDFWVCWTLRELFREPEWGPHLVFKGGTSLSKAWKLISTVLGRHRHRHRPNVSRIRRSRESSNLAPVGR